MVLRVTSQSQPRISQSRINRSVSTGLEYNLRASLVWERQSNGDHANVTQRPQENLRRSFKINHLAPQRVRDLYSLEKINENAVSPDDTQSWLHACEWCVTHLWQVVTRGGLAAL